MRSPLPEVLTHMHTSCDISVSPFLFSAECSVAQGVIAGLPIVSPVDMLHSVGFPEVANYPHPNCPLFDVCPSLYSSNDFMMSQPHQSHLGGPHLPAPLCPQRGYAPHQGPRNTLYPHIPPSFLSTPIPAAGSAQAPGPRMHSSPKHFGDLDQVFAAQENEVFKELHELDAVLENLRTRGNRATLSASSVSAGFPSEVSEHDSRSTALVGSSVADPAASLDGRTRSAPRSRPSPRRPSPYADRYSSPTSWHRASPSRWSGRQSAYVERPPPEPRDRRLPCSQAAAVLPAWKLMHMSLEAPMYGVARRMPHVQGPHLSLRCLNCRKVPEEPPVVPVRRPSRDREGSPDGKKKTVKVEAHGQSGKRAGKRKEGRRKPAATEGAPQSHIEVDLNQLLIQSHQINKTLEDVQLLDDSALTDASKTSADRSGAADRQAGRALLEVESITQGCEGYHEGSKCGALVGISECTTHWFGFQEESSTLFVHRRW